jgi:hypothetical protein
LGVVKVSAPRDKRCVGTAPEIVVDVFLARPQRERDRLIKGGVVKMAEQRKDPYYGAVTVELF